MKVLVTGSTGFIGSKLCAALIQSGYQVRAFHRATSNLAGLSRLDVEHAIGDLTDEASVFRALTSDIRIVFHTAALLKKPSSPQEMSAVTVRGTHIVMQAAMGAGVDCVVHTSSVAALGVPEEGPCKPSEPQLIDETHTWNFKPAWWPYGYAKYLAEMEVQRAVANGLHAIIVNPANVVGPGDLYRTKSSILAQTAHKRIPFSISGGLNIVHIDDVIRGHLAALENGKNGERYILGGENLSVTDFLSMAAQAAGKGPPRYTIPGKFVRKLASIIHPFIQLFGYELDESILNLGGYYFFYDTRKSRNDLGLPAPTPVTKAIEEAIQWFQSNSATN